MLSQQLIPLLQVNRSGALEIDQIAVGTGVDRQKSRAPIATREIFRGRHIDSQCQRPTLRNETQPEATLFVATHQQLTGWTVCGDRPNLTSRWRQGTNTGLRANSNAGIARQSEPTLRELQQVSISRSGRSTRAWGHRPRHAITRS